jgi:hypothetical protein
MKELSRFGSLFLCASMLNGCGQARRPAAVAQALMPIPCMTTSNCVARGGACMAGFCHADNECASTADCAAGQTCVPDPQFGGLCAAPNRPAAPTPAWSCTYGRDCPTGQGCGDDGLCHSDGECHADADCSTGAICYPGLASSNSGFCSGARPSRDPYCRADGHGACRSLCASTQDCGTGLTCVTGYCHFDDECQVQSDCSPNHLCQPRLGTPEYGYRECVMDPNPTCVTAPDGVCRFACKTDVDCTQGGGCRADGFCHASNECKQDSDCAAGEICYSRPLFGGLCGPARP